MGDIDPFTPAVELAAAVRRKDVSPVELADLYLDRIERFDGTLNAFAHRADDEVRAAAREAADRLANAADIDALPPFLGVPIPIKDLDDVAGWPTTFGSKGADPGPATESDPVVRRFVDAGFVLLGKTATPEFGAISFTESDALGTTRNPWDHERTCGGSSGGAGAAVASAMAPIAHGSDGGGSIRIPASCNGLVGLKPTRGRITARRIDGEGLSTNGVLARTVADAAAGLDVLAVHDPAAWWSPPSPTSPFAESVAAALPAGLRVGSLRIAAEGMLPVDPACASAVDLVVLELAAAGHHPVDQLPQLPSVDEAVAAFGLIWNTLWAGVPLADPDAVEPVNRGLRDAAREVDSWAYVESVHASQDVSRRLVESFMAGFDLLVTPTMACLPPPVGAWRQGTDDNPMLALVNCYPMAVFTSLFNVCGLPAISVPVHHDDATGLPVGVQIVAAPWREDLLLQVAAFLEQELPWRDRRPAGY